MQIEAAKLLSWALRKLTIITLDGITLEGKTSEVTKITTGKPMLLLGDFQTCSANRLAGIVNKRPVWDGRVSVRASGSVKINKLGGFDAVF